MKTIAATICLMLLGGCSAQHWGGDTAGQRPGVKFKTGIFYGTSIEMTSDGTVSVDNFTIAKTKDGYSASINGMDLVQTPSINTTAEIEKLNAIADLQAVQVAYVKELTEGLAQIASAVMPMGASWPQLLMYMGGKVLMEKYKQPAMTQPTSQPSN